MTNPTPLTAAELAAKHDQPIIRPNVFKVNGQNFRRPRPDEKNGAEGTLHKGDVRRTRSNGILQLWFNKGWEDIPTTTELMEFTLDSVCPTPDGDTVEPDHPDSWLSLLGFI